MIEGMSIMFKKIIHIKTLFCFLLLSLSMHAMKKREAIELQETQPAKKAATMSPQELQHNLSIFDALPDDIKLLILEKVIVSSINLEKAIEEIKKIRLINKAANEFITSPAVLQWIITKLAFEFSHETVSEIIRSPMVPRGMPAFKHVTEEIVFKKLLPLTDTPETRTWLNNQKSFIAWRNNLHNAIDERNLEKLKILLQENKNIFKRNLNNISLRGRPPLHMASNQRWPEGVVELIKNGADPNLEKNILNRFSSTPLSESQSQISANRGSEEFLSAAKKTIEALVLSGAIINNKYRKGSTLLTQSLEDILFSADYDETNNARESELYYDFLKFLLEKGADPNIKSDKGFTPLFMILIKNYRDPVVGVIKLVQLFIDHGADPNLPITISPQTFYEYHGRATFYNPDEEEEETYINEAAYENYKAIRQVLKK